MNEIVSISCILNHVWRCSKTSQSFVRLSGQELFSGSSTLDNFVKYSFVCSFSLCLAKGEILFFFFKANWSNMLFTRVQINAW